MPRVLIVDDHAFIRRGVQSILEPFPEWELCGEAENGQEAVQKSSELHPEVIIMDVSMPLLSGIAAAEIIKNMHPEIRIVLLTLHDSAELARKAFRAGVRGYLLKTDADSELLKALLVVIGDGSYITPQIDEQIAKTVIAESSTKH
jgi:two-component system, NarL family, nitrate/nitrite response regulator NarL